MSNAIVGDIYAQVIEKVKFEAAEIFEEAGIPASVLDELEREWQKNLTLTKVASFPWDTPPPVSPQQPHIPDISEADPNSQQLPIFDQPNQPVGFNTYDAPKAFTGSSLNTKAAQERAASLLREKYGTQASASIAAGLGQQAPPPQTQEYPSASVDVTSSSFAPETKLVPEQQPSRQPLSTVVNPSAAPTALPVEPSSDFVVSKPPEQTVPQSDAGEEQYVDQKDNQPQYDPSQTDGTGEREWNYHLLNRNAGETLEANNTLRSLIEQASDEATAGLMTSLQDHQQRRQLLLRRRRRRKESKHGKETIHPCDDDRQLGRTIGQFDGEYEDDDLDDDDIINSDLDDPEDIYPSGDDDMDSFIVCTYEKVNRVKAKWKVVLLDGILKTDGKNFLFHRATSDFEW